MYRLLNIYQPFINAVKAEIINLRLSHEIELAKDAENESERFINNYKYQNESLF